ncbi:hypothetical protein BpHYR1_044984, partial [Brachionus plicatilis]
AERLAVLDHENLEMLVLRAREHEGLPFGFSGIGERSRNMFNQGTGRPITEGEIRNLITPKLESNIMFQNQNKHDGNSQNNVETIRNSYDNSYVNASLTNISNYSKLLNNSNDGSSLNRSKPMATIRNDQRNQFSANTNNINEESDNYDLKYVFGIGTNEVKLDVFVAVDLQHDCLIGLDYMGKVQGTRDKLKEIYSSLGGEEKNKRE